MASINIRGVTFAYVEDHPVFEDLTLSIDTDWKLGLVGRNGRGKTTLIRILTGQLEPQLGKVDSPVGFDSFPYRLKSDLLALDALREAAPVDFEDWQVERELRKMGVNTELLDRPVHTLSGGERTKLMLAALFSAPGRFLLIDEPTNHLDVDGRRLVAKYLAGQRGFLLVSHDRAFLDATVDHILSLNKSGQIIEQGNYSSFAHNQALRDEYEIERNERLQREISDLERSQRDKRNWSDKIERSKIGGHVADRGAVGHKAARMMQRAKAIQTRQQRAIDEKKELLQDIEYASALKITPLFHDKRVLVRATDLTLGYDGVPVLENISFQLEQGKCIAIVGANGSGKSTILKAILGQLEPMSGELYIAPRMKISHVSQETSHLRGPVREFAQSQGIDLTKFLMLLRKLDFPKHELESWIERMSEGQKKKILIAASLCTEAHLYLWDEPLNFIDVMSRKQIEDLIDEGRPTMVLIEHDERFVDRLCEMKVEIESR